MMDKKLDALLKEYAEVCSNFRTLRDIRFKLLVFLPITAAATALTGGGVGVVGLALSLFGLVIDHCLGVVS
jgi:hypothetical protein